MLPWLFLASLVASTASSREGFLNCSGDISEHALRRAYRLMVKESHPDKGGSNEQTAELTSLRDSLLREPLRFQVLRAMFEASLQPFDTSARAQVEFQEGWPYLQVEFDFDHGGLLMDGGSWTFAFGLKNGSTVHYRGDERIGGYDVCCDFLRDSRCQRHPVGSKANASDSASCQSLGQCDAGLYATSDCPLPDRVVARVRRPLHQNITGQWGGALQIRSTSGVEVACLAFAFAHMAPFEETTPHSLEAETETVKSPEIQRPDPDTDGSAFQHVGSGSFCEDGGDLLEGALDNYGGLSPFGGARRASAESSLFYGSRCRERCRRRPLCRFYTAYSSGWCQLSSRCSVLARAGDPLTVTFAPAVQRPDFVEIGDDMMADWSALSCLSSRPDPSRAAGSRDDSHMACLGIEQLRSREVWRGALMDLAKNSRQSLIHSSVRRNLVEAERRSLLKNFPTAKKIAFVLFGKPDEDFRDWVKQRTRSDYEAAKEQLERRRSSAEAAGEEPPVDDLKEPPEADFPSKMEVSDKVLAHELKNFSLPDKAEGFDEIRYEWADEAGAKAGLLQWLREQKARRIVEGLAPGEWFDKKYKDWKDARRVFQNGQRDFSTRSQGDDSLADKVSAIDLSEVKDPHNADGEGTPIYGNFKYEDWVVLSWRYELHLLSHAFPIDAADSDRLGVPEEHMEHYWRIYYHHHFEPRKLGAANLRDALKVLKEPIQLKETSSGSRILVSTCDRESSIDAFVVSVEAYRRDRCRRIEAGDESAALNIPRQSKAPGPEGKATGKGVMKSAPKTTPKAKPPQPSSSPGPTGGKAPPKAPVAKMPAPQNSGGEAKRPHPPNAPPTKRTPEGHLAGRSGADQVKKAPPPKGSVGKLVAKPPQPSSSPGPTGGKAPPKAPVSKTPAKHPQNSGGEGKAKVALAKMPAKRPHPPSNGPPTKRSRSEERE